MGAQLQDKASLIARFERYALWLEDRVGVGLTSVLCGTILLSCAGLYVTPARDCVSYGKWYEALSLDPFHPKSGNLVHLRIVTPLVAYLLHFRGPLFIFFPLIVTVLFLAAIYFVYRRKEFSPVLSILMTSTVTFSTPTLFLLHFQGYTDTTSYLLFFAASELPRWPEVAAALCGVACLNHESTTFMLPALIAMHWRRRTSLWSALRLTLGLAAALGVVVWIRKHLPKTEGLTLNEEFYLSYDHVKANVLELLKLLPLGIFMAFRALWLIPLAAGFVLARRGARRHFLALAAIVCGAFLQLLFASDTSRLLGWAFPAVLIGAEVLREFGDEYLLQRRLGLCLLVSLLLPEYYIGQDHIFPMFSLPAALLIKYLFGVDLFDQWWLG